MSESFSLRTCIHVVPAITNEASGPSYSVVRLCESLIEQGQNVTLAGLDWAPMIFRPPFLKTFPLGQGPRKLGRSPLMKHWLVSQVMSKKVNLLHNHGMWQMNAVYPAWAAKKGDIDLIISPRGAFSQWAMQQGSKTKKLFWTLLQSPALASTSCFHATSESEYKDIRRLGFRQPVAIIPNGIDIPNQIPKRDKGCRTLLFLGRIHPKKGLDILLPAWQTVQLRLPEWRLRIVGPDNGGYLTQMRQLAADLKLQRIEFSGPLYGVDKWKAYAQADLFVLPTYSENFGISVAEALASGTPAIVTKGAPWADLEVQRAGWWIDIGVEPLVKCLEEALVLPHERLTEMSYAGREWMKQDFAWDQIGEKMTETYRWLLDRSMPIPAWVRMK